MSNIVLKAENISKQYRLGLVGTGTLRDDWARLWAKMRGKEDPTLKLGAVNDRDKIEGQYVWALQDINFEVNQGEVLGIIGKNGAGKSTLLKILSRVTSPTTGSIKTRGRIASLLEVGTGFHPELTGRENVFLNGAILGMTKSEIKRKFDEIVDFSGIGKYIDTPVKRYSSGMYVRLAFAVAAHLDPEILIVDEVLAVGDAEFQKKCLGKMKDVSVNEGRTVLFVSHNMAAIQTLCTNCVYLRNGRVQIVGDVKKVTDTYLGFEVNLRGETTFRAGEKGDDFAYLLSAKLLDKNDKIRNIFDIKEEIYIEIEYEVLRENQRPLPNIHLLNAKEEYIFVKTPDETPLFFGKGKHKVRAKIDKNFLNDDSYKLRIALTTCSPVIIHADVQDALSFEITENIRERNNTFTGAMPGVIRPKLLWQHC